MNRQKVSVSVLAWLREQKSVPFVQIAICTEMRGLTLLSFDEFTWPRMRHFYRRKFRSLSHVWSRLITLTPSASLLNINLA